MLYILPVILAALLFIEASFTTIPVAFLFLLLLTIFKKSSIVFIVAFFVGVLMDILLLRPLGMTSMVYLLILFLVTLYDRKFEIATTSFIGFSSFFGSLIYLLVFQNQVPILQAIVSAIFAVLAAITLFKSQLKIRKALI